jgi:four helix bundle protein
MESNDYKRFLKEKVYRYSLKIIKFIEKLDNRNFTVQIISKQLLRSATSIGANIIEAQACGSKKDFINFMNISLKSSNETKYWLGLLRDSQKAEKMQVENLLVEVNEISNILGSSILRLKGKK